MFRFVSFSIKKKQNPQPKMKQNNQKNPTPKTKTQHIISCHLEATENALISSLHLPKLFMQKGIS